MKPFLNSPDVSNYSVLYTSTYLVQIRIVSRILFMFLCIIHNTLLFPFVYMLISPPNPNFLEVTNQVLLIFAHPPSNMLKMLSTDHFQLPVHAVRTEVSI